MIQLIAFIVILIFLFYFLYSRNETYTTYDNLYQAYTVPYMDLTFIAAGDRPALGHYLRLADNDGLSPMRNEYEDKFFKYNKCNRCMVHCLNPTSLLYNDEALGLCKEFCGEECSGKNVEEIIEDSFIESKMQMRHNKSHEQYDNVPVSYYYQGGWTEYPSWFENK